VLVRIKGWSGKRVNWLLIKHRDEHAHEGDADALLAENRSVASGRSMADIAAGKGRAPNAFMAADGPAIVAKDAVWDSSVGLEFYEIGVELVGAPPNAFNRPLRRRSNEGRQYESTFSSVREP
jgi:hypothetical protein